MRFGRSDNFIKNWPNLQLKLICLLNKVDADDCANFGFDGTITSILILLRALSMKKTYAMNVEKLIVYSDVSSSLLVHFFIHKLFSLLTYRTSMEAPRI